jgi:hypothetical protein
VPIPSNLSFIGQSLQQQKKKKKKSEIKIRKFEKELLGSEKNKCKINHQIHTFGFLSLCTRQNIEG